MPLHSSTIDLLLSNNPFLTIRTLAQTSGTELISAADTTSSPLIFNPLANFSKKEASSDFHSPELGKLAT